MKLTLRPFENSKSSASGLHLSVQAQVSLSTNPVDDTKTLVLKYFISGEISQIEFPTQESQLSKQERLWEDTCFEAFLGEEKKSPYWEINFSPSGLTHTYLFENYRKRATRPHSLPLRVVETSHIYCVEAPLPADLCGKKLELGLSAVLKLKSGEIQYWALKHCGTKPDFHLRESFTVKL